MNELTSLLSEVEQKKFEKLLKVGVHYFTPDKLNLIKISIQNISKAYNDKKCDFSQNSFLCSVLDIAIIAVEEIGMGASSVLAILQYEAVKNDNITLKHIEHTTNKNIATIIKGLLQIEELDTHAVFDKDFSTDIQILAEKSKRAKKYAITANEYYLNQAENFRKLFLNLSDDMRIILILLAKQLYISRNLKNLDSKEKLAYSRESYYMYAPIAHQLGLYKTKTEFEELSMKILESKMYQFIAKKLDETKKNRNEYINSFIQPIKKALNEKLIIAELKGRPKSIHSIWNKIKKQNVEFEGIYDLFAVRIIIDNEFTHDSEEKSACWNVYSMITDVWTPSPKRLRDWISSPKASGYESLHTTVLGPDNKWVEVQIRTRRMDDIAEKGQAAHWKYKEVKGENGHTDWLDEIRAVLENPEESTEESEEKKELYGDNIFVFTPKGEIKKLRKTATVLDFAYSIHTRVGEQCTGAKINGIMEGLKYQLKNGDKVEILNSKTQKPKAEWLNFVASPSTKGRIKRYLNNEIHKKAEEGKILLDQKIEVLKGKNQGIDLPNRDKILGKLRNHFKINSNLKILSQLQENTLQISEKLLHSLLIEPGQQNLVSAIDKLKELASEKENKKDNDFLYISDKLSGIEFHLAKCCSPIPGDSIFGFVTVNKGTKIHKANCPNAHDMLNRYPYRMVKARWKESNSQQFSAKLKVVGENTMGVVSDITTLITRNKKLNMTAININTNENNMFEGEISVNVFDTEHLNILLKALKKIKGVHNAYRYEYRS